jgi:hypothetical protein
MTTPRGHTGGTSRLRSTALTVLWTILAAAPSVAGSQTMAHPDRWQAHARVGVLDNVTLRVHWHDSLEALRVTARDRNVQSFDARGFSILRRDTMSGAWVCDVFVIRLGGTLVDREKTTTFGHEVLHCVGFSHD